MLQKFQRVLLALAVVGAVSSASAFSLLGPFDAGYQTPEIGYNQLGTDIGGPLNLGEEYRWNIRTITYGFDSSFLTYFGARGTQEVKKAIAILNNLPSASQMSPNLTEFPLDTKRYNYQAGALGLRDLKSITLTFLVEEMGLTSPERYVWTLRNRRVANNTTFYTVIKRNFDPVTLAPSSYVNGTLYTYQIGEFTSGGQWADAVEAPVDPLAYSYKAVVSAASPIWGGWLGAGEYFTGLTRDDVGGLRYVYGVNNYNMENLMPGTTSPVFDDCPWCPVTGGTNLAVTNVIVDLALRPGGGKITFQEAQYDSTFGTFIVVARRYTDTYVTNSALDTQTTERVLTQPDILFTAEDLGLTTGGVPIAMRRTVTAGWANNDGINGATGQAGPGVIQPQVVISFSNIGPYFFNQTLYNLDEATAASGFVWGSFDGSTNPPVVYPSGISIQELENEVLGGP